MRLINTTTGLLEEFIGDEIPEYAILSHTWEKDEISLQEFQRLTDPDFANDPKTLAVKAKAGFIKIRGYVELAASKGIPYAWVDTCCIDKTSSADLTESINSMFRWYANSRVCFAYLVDVESDDGTMGRWMESRWFTRGWTLQELIAPPEVEFYRQSWDFLGTKKSSYLFLSKKTGILKEVLETNDLSSVSVAQKMSWASDRRTTRKEDRAYCLLGLFDVNMPLLYGEGEKAFSRLQEHIAASSTDHSLFAWGIPTGSADETGNHQRSYRSIFARLPPDFRECGEVEQETIIHPDTWTQTNRGLHAVFPTLWAVAAKHLFDDSEGLPDYIDDTDYLVILNCYSSVWERNALCFHAIGIWISLIDTRDDGKHGFCRVTDFTTLRREGHVSKLLNSSQDKFRKDLWFMTSRVVQVPRDYFSKRLSGFLIPPQKSWVDGDIKIHSLYGTRVSDDVDLLPCPLLPLDTLGGLVGVVTVNYSVNVRDVDYYGGAKIIFGYPPGLKKPFARVLGSYYYDDEALLEDDLQEYVELELNNDNGDNDDDDAGYVYRSQLFAISLSLGTVFHKDMIFTQLDIQLHTWY
jgi:hypothetical protein